MTSVLRTVIVDADEATRSQLKSALSGMDIIWLEGEYSEYEGCAEPLAAAPPDVLLVSIDADRDAALRLISRIARQDRECGICAVSTSTDGQVILRAIRAGAKEFLNTPVDVEALIEVLRSLGGLDAEDGKRLRSSMTIAVAGSAGGVGSTSVAVNLASILAADTSKSVVLVDLDLTLGDADVFLDAIYEYTLADLTQDMGRLDLDLLRRSLTRHNSGLYLLPRPVDLEDAPLVTEDALRRVLTLLRASFSHIVLDLSKSYSRLDLAALESCDAALLVTQLDLPSLRNVVRLLKSFQGIEGLDEKVKLVVNRSAPTNDAIRLKKAEEIVGQPFFWQIPNGFRLMIELRNNGVPLIQQAPRSEITQSLIGMSRALCGDAKPAESSSRRGNGSPRLGRWLSFLPSSAAKSAPIGN